jgi:hypothetical protein
MSMEWTSKRPTVGGFYYWQNGELSRISRDAVRVVQVGKYKNREGFNVHTLMRNCEPCSPFFDCDLGKEPTGHWAGPLPQPTESGERSRGEA